MESQTMETDPMGTRRFAAVLGGLLYGVSGVVVIATAWLLPDEVDRAPLIGFAVAAVIVGAIIPLLPGHLPWLPATLVIAAQIHLAVAGLIVPGAIEHYLSLYVLSYLYVGMTQPRRTGVFFVPLTIASFAIATSAGTDNLVNFVVMVPVAVVGGEVLAYLLERQQRQLDDVGKVLHATKRLVAAVSVDDAAAVIGELAMDIIAAGSVAILVADPDQPNLFVARMRSRSLDPLGPLSVDIDAEPTGITAALRSGHMVVVPDAATAATVSCRLAVATGAGSVAYVPLVDGPTPVGAIVAIWQQAGARPATSPTQLLELIADAAGPILGRLRDRDRLSLEAETDPLTGLANRRTFGRALDSCGAGDALVMVDLDGFKLVNDVHGHPFGDDVLRALASCLTQAARERDCVARFGGEEFAVILPAAGAEGVRTFLARVRHDWTEGLPVTTFSTGFAVRHADEAPLLTLGRADAALYEAKARGRNTDVEAAPASLSDNL